MLIFYGLCTIELPSQCILYVFIHPQTEYSTFQNSYSTHKLLITEQVLNISELYQEAEYRKISAYVNKLSDIFKQFLGNNHYVTNNMPRDIDEPLMIFNMHFTFLHQLWLYCGLYNWNRYALRKAYIYSMQTTMH